MSELLQSPDEILLTNDDEIIFSSDRPMLAVLKKLTGTITTSAHAPDLSYDANHTVDHLIGTVPLGTERVIGWGRLVNPTGYLPADRPFNLSGGVVLTGVATTFGGGFAQVITLWHCIQPHLAGGNVYLREIYFTHRFTSPSYAGNTIPATEIEYDLRAVAFVGGT
jgi:hypothetical protein